MDTEHKAICDECGDPYVKNKYWQRYCCLACKITHNQRKLIEAREYWREHGQEAEFERRAANGRR
jgi:hypothetical protein